MQKVKLTPRRIMEIEPPDSGERFIFDTEVPGLAIRKRCSGSASFIFQYRPKGQPGRSPRRITIGSTKSVSLSDARNAAKQHYADVVLGGDPIKERQRQRQEIELSQALDDYERSLVRRKVVNAKVNMSTLRRHMLKPIGNVLLNDLTRRRLVARIEKVAETLPGAAQDLRQRSTAFLSWAESGGLIERNPMTGWRRERTTRAERKKPRGRMLSDNELSCLWAVTDGIGEVNRTFGRLVRFVMLTGQRRTETAVMRWRDVNLDSAWWTIPEGIAKNGREHRVPLPPMAVEIMRSQRQKMPDDFVFEGRHSGKPMSGWSQMADTLRTESNIPDFGLHDLRRTFRSGLTKLRYAPDVDVEIDSDLAEIMLNHTRAELIEIYDREPRYEARMAAAKAWANYVAKVIGHGGVVRLEEMK